MMACQAAPVWKSRRAGEQGREGTWEMGAMLCVFLLNWIMKPSRFCCVPLLSCSRSTAQHRPPLRYHAARVSIAYVTDSSVYSRRPKFKGTHCLKTVLQRVPSPADSASLAKAALTVSPLPLCAFSTSTISAGIAPLSRKIHRMLHTGLQLHRV